MSAGIDVGINIRPLSFSHIQERQGPPITPTAQSALTVAVAYIKNATPQRGLAGLNFTIDHAAVTADDLPAFLQKNYNLTPLQLARVILGMNNQIHTCGDTSFTFTQGQILSWAGDKSLDQHLTNLCLTLQKNKNNPASLFAANSPKSQGLLPSVHVPGGDNPVAPLADSEETASISGGVEVIDPCGLIGLLGIDTTGLKEELELTTA